MTLTTTLFFAAVVLCLFIFSSHQFETNNHSGNDNMNTPVRPLLLIPGFGASILEAHHKTNKSQPAIRVFESFEESQMKLERFLLFKYCSDCLLPESVNSDYTIQAPIDIDSGLYAISRMNPDGTGPARLYFYDMIEFLKNELGYVPGKTLFAFPYDWRLNSAQISPQLLSHVKKILEITKESGATSVDVISHSYGGVLFKQTLLNHAKEARSLFHTYVSIASPWKGTGMDTPAKLLMGTTMNNRDWNEDTVRAMQLASPSVYELISLAYYHSVNSNKKHQESPLPLFSYEDSNGETHKLNMEQAFELMNQILKNHSIVDYTGQKQDIPFNMKRVVDFEHQANKFLSKASENGLENTQPRYVYNIVGAMVDTMISARILDRVNNVYDIAYSNSTRYSPVDKVSGDGLVPLYSGSDNGFHTLLTTYKRSTHNGILREKSTFEDLRQFLGFSCPFYGSWNMTIVEPIANETHSIRVSGDILYSHSPQLSMNGSVLSNTWTGQAIGSLGGASFTIVQAKDCQSFTGTWHYGWMINSVPIVGVRVIGEECTSDRACHVDNGEGSRKCNYGYLATTCMIKSCEKDYMMTVGQPYARSLCVPSDTHKKSNYKSWHVLLGLFLGAVGLLLFVIGAYVAVTLIGRFRESRKAKLYASSNNSSYTQMLTEH